MTKQFLLPPDYWSTIKKYYPKLHESKEAKQYHILARLIAGDKLTLNDNKLIGDMKNTPKKHFNDLAIRLYTKAFAYYRQSQLN